MTTLELIKSDFKARGVNPTLPRIIICTLFSYSYKQLIYIRLCMGGGKFCQLIRPILLRKLKKRYHIELGCREIGPYLRLPHPYGIIIAAKSIGENVMIGQYVTLGGNNCKERQGSNGEPIHTPVIGNNCQISTGSVVAGPITIGNNVVIGANSTITKDIPSGTLLYNSTGVSRHSYIVPGWKGAFHPV